MTGDVRIDAAVSVDAVARQVRDEVADRLSDLARQRSSEGAVPLSPSERRLLGTQLIEQALDARAQRVLAGGGQVWTQAEEEQISRVVTDALFGMGGLQPLLDDAQVENINVNGCDRVFVRYADGGRASLAPVAASDAELVELVRALAARAGVQERRFDRGSPRLNLQLPDGSRLFAVMAVTGRPCLSIRRHRFPLVHLSQLRLAGMIDARLESLLAAAVRARRNIVVAGGTGIGKTTLLRGLASAIPAQERLVTIEDALELGLDRNPAAHPDVVAMQAREPNTEGEGEITQAELVRWALRMSPDRVIVGEVRGPEVVPMCNAMSQGNDGSMATVHSSTSRGVFTRLATYAVQAPERLPLEAVNLLVASAVHLVVHLAWASDGRRVVSSVREVVDADGAHVVSNEVFRPRPDHRGEPAAPLRTDTVDDLAAHGFDPDLLADPAAGWTPC